MDKVDTVIIGGGAGGTALGALLSSAGQRVVLVEKNSEIGGRLASYEKDGFSVDVGVHIFSLGHQGPIGEAFRRAGQPHTIEWVEARSPRASIFMEGKLKPFSQDFIFERVAETERQNIIRLFTEAIQINDAELNNLWHTPLTDWISGFTTDPFTYNMLDYLCGIYFCIRAERASAAEFISCFREVTMKRSSAYPLGGCSAIPFAFTRIIERNGGEVRLSCPAQKIIIENNAAKGVVAGGETIHADQVVSNADIKASITGLADAGHFPEDYLKRINDLEYTPSAVSLKVALKKKITDQKMIMYIPDRDEKAGLEIAGGMIVSPTNFDPDLAPPGKQLISLGSRCERGQDMTKWKRVLFDAFREVLPGIEEQVMWTALDTPATIEYFAGEGGAIIGAAQTVDQVRERRPSHETPVKNLYLCSAEAGGHGIGAELAVSSALELYDKLI